MTIVIAWKDRSLSHFAKKLGELNVKFPRVAAQEVNKVGASAKTQVIRNLSKQTGLPRRVIVAAVGDPAQARPGKLSYEMKTRGGEIRLKYFSPQETLPGVVAKPFGKKTLYDGAFMKGGAFPQRKVVARFDGHVYRRLNKSGTHITQVRSNVVIPVEMTQGATLRAFEVIAGPLLQQRLYKVLKKLVP